MNTVNREPGEKIKKIRTETKRLQEMQNPQTLDLYSDYSGLSLIRIPLIRNLALPKRRINGKGSFNGVKVVAHAQEVLNF